ncbi:MAG: hypothetical protein ACLFQS_03955 [Bacteroidales bacterium]
MGNIKKDHLKIRSTTEQSLDKSFSCHYERFFYVKSYLKDKYFELICRTDQTQMSELISTMMNISGFALHERGKLFHLIEKWNNLLLPVPLDYLKLIGYDREKLDEMYQKDVAAFKRALRRRYVPDSFILVFSNGSLRMSLPASFTEEEAIDYVKNWKTEISYERKTIRIKDLKSIHICPNGEHYITTYPPVLSFRNDKMYVVNETSKDQKLLRKHTFPHKS